VQALVAQREAARTAKDFAASDELRGQIEMKGFQVKDTPLGPTITKK
jgi:cysteinyl-tRNA synthetase